MNCPYCTLEIADGSIKCNHCDSILTDQMQQNGSSLDANPQLSEIQTTKKKRPSRKKTKVSSEPSVMQATNNSIGRAVICGCIGVALFYFGGWDIMWGGQPDWYMLAGVYKKGVANDYVVSKHALLFKIDSTYYGIYKISRFFESSFIQWVMGFTALFAFYESLKNLVKDG